MKLLLEKNELEKKLSAGIKFISTKLSSIQSLQGGRLYTKNKKIFLSTTNLNDFFEAKIQGEIKEEGETIFDIKKASEFLSLLPSGETQLETIEKEVQIKQQKTKGRFKTAPIEDFPLQPRTKGKSVVLTKKDVEKIMRVVFSSSKDESRPVLTGIYITKKGNNVDFVTTDGFRLSVLTLKSSFGLDGLIVPAFVFIETARFSEGEELNLTFDEKEKLMKTTTGSYCVVSRLLDGEFPPYEKVVPTTSKTKAVFLREELIKKIKLISVFAREQADIVVFDIKKEGVFLKPKADQGSGSVVFTEHDSFFGEELKIAFNYRYVLDFLNNTNQEKVSLEFNHGTSPGIFREIVKKDKEEFLHIIMPLRTDETS